MKKILFCLSLVLMSACALNSEPQLQNNGKVSYSKQAKEIRPFMFGNPSITEIAKKNGMKEVVSVEKDYYVIVNTTTVKGN